MEWTTSDDLHNSDHYPIIIKSSYNRSQYVTPIQYNLSKADWNAFNANFSPPYLSGNIEEDVYNLTRQILETADSTVPKKGGKMLRPPIPWWNDECKLANSKKKKAFNRFKRHPTQENLITFKQCRARERYIIKRCKKESLTAYISKINTSSDVKEVWNIIKSFSLGRKMPTVPLLLNGDNVLNEADEVTEYLAKHFAQISSNEQYSEDFLAHKNEVEKEVLNFCHQSQETYNVPFNLTELDHALGKAKDTAPGIDKISYIMIKNLPPSGKNSLLRIYNNIWESSTYPESWREALIIPILKEGKDPSSVGSYRPISLTSCLSKILESMINERLVYILETRGLLNPYQAGFRKHHSTIDQLSHLEIYIQEAFKEQEHVLAVFFDLERAYDTTWRYMILKKCYLWGFQGNLPNFLKSFLLDRRFRVRIGNATSEVHPLETGTPQGSVQEVAAKMQVAIDKISMEADKTVFKLSQTKTSAMHFCRMRKEHYTPRLYLKGLAIPFKEKIRFLGIIFDPKLTWKDQIDQTIINCKKSINIIKFLSAYRWNLDRDTLLKIFTALIRPKLEYGLPVIASARKSQLIRLTRLYNQSVRLATGAFRTSPLESLFVEAEIMPPQLRWEQLLLTYAAGLWGKPNHFLFEYFFENIDEEFYEGNITRTRPINVRVLELMNQEELQFGPIEALRFPVNPPWIAPHINVLMDLAESKKEETNPEIYRWKFKEILEGFSDYTVIYTDGSKSESGVGSAVFTRGITHTWTLPKYASIYSAEIYALYQATKMSVYDQTQEILICSDSLSALTALKDPFSMNPMIQNIMHSVHDAYQKGKNVIFVWVPGHIGLAGNEHADTGAKRAAASEPPEECIPICSLDLKAHCRSVMIRKWQHLWDTSSRSLRAIKQNVNCGWKEKMDRRDGVVLTRLRIGHTCLTHLCRLVGARPPKCRHCNEPISVKHLLEGCQTLVAHKSAVGLTGDLISILKDVDMVKLTKYLRNINVYDEI